jgi:hypothetical protein
MNFWWLIIEENEKKRPIVESTERKKESNSLCAHFDRKYCIFDSNIDRIIYESIKAIKESNRYRVRLWVHFRFDCNFDSTLVIYKSSRYLLRLKWMNMWSIELEVNYRALVIVVSQLCLCLLIISFDSINWLNWMTYRLLFHKIWPIHPYTHIVSIKYDQFRLFVN